MSNSATKPSRRLASCHYSLLLLPMRVRSRFRLLHLLFTLHIILFLIVYHRFILITPSSIESIDAEKNSLCYIPRFDPWDQTIAKSIRLKPLYRCPTQKRNLINVVDNTHLIINQMVNRTSFAGSVTHCLYMKVDRNPEEKLFRDWSYTLSEPILITDGRSEAIRDADFVLTRCFNDRRRHFNGEHFCGYNCTDYRNLNASEQRLLTNRTLVYEYIHPLIRLKKPAFSYDTWLQTPSSTPVSQSHRSPPSIIMIILDAVSDLQAQRALPHTLAYLKSLGLYRFERHAVVGDGTFENIVPMLFGLPGIDLQVPNTDDTRYEFVTTEIHVDRKTKIKTRVNKIVHYPGPYDDYPFIAKNFSALNYTTFFSEEWRESAFYNLKNGFRQAPTDFYLRPYWLSLYETLSYNKFQGNSNPKPCYLDKLLHMLSLDWLKDFLTVHHRQPGHPTLGIMKMNEMSHDYLERLFWIDYDMKTFFQDLVQQHLLDNTIVIFCGDHGHRQHRLRLTRIGSFEVKLPFFSMLMPQSFEKSFPQAMKNLARNQKTLTSWWDVYETLVNVLRMVETPHLFDPLLVNWQPTTAGRSLFHPISERNCSSAGIPEKYCPCSRATPMDIDLPIIREVAIASVNYINNVKLKSHQHLCMVLQLKTIIRAELEELQAPVVLNRTTKASFTQLYTVLFEVSPSEGIFESRLLYDPLRQTIQLHSGILRINLYGQTSACIRDQYDLRSFCYCITYHKKLKHTVHKTKRALPIAAPVNITKPKT